MKSLVSLLIIILIFTTSIICFSSCAKDGTDGKDGADGKTPTIEISEDGYWVINGEKTDVKAEGKDGEPGKDGVGGSANENPQGLDFYLKDDGTYAVAVGNAKYLSHIEIPELYCGKPVTEIAYDGFKGAQNLKSVSIPNSITSIGDSAFSNCSSLTSITIPDGVTSIGHYMFLNCSSLTSVTIPDSVTSIGDSVLYGCSSLTSITLPFIDRAMMEFYGMDLDDIFDLIENPIPLKSIVVTDGTEIPDYAFVGCTSLTSFTIPDDVTSIGVRVFHGCTSLTSIVIPDSVTSIGDRAFSGCDSLTSVVIGDGVTSIDTYAFYNCESLTDVYYTGTKEEWAKISIGDFNSNLKNATIHYNYVP